MTVQKDKSHILISEYQRFEPVSDHLATTQNTLATSYQNENHSEHLTNHLTPPWHPLTIL